MTEPTTVASKTNTTFVLSDALYQKLKFLALVLIPALSTLYFSLGGVWNLPNVTEVIGSMTAVDTFLGVILGLSTRSYNASDAKFDGSIVTTTRDDDGVPVTVFSLELNDGIDKLETMESVTFKILPKS